MTLRNSPSRPAPSLIVLAAAGLLLAGCSAPGWSALPASRNLGEGRSQGAASPPAPHLDPVASAASLGSRSLRDEDLQRYVTQNLGHAPAAWDFESLTWVAFYYQPSLEVLRAQWEIARGAQKTAAARPNPTLTVTPGFSANPGDSSPWFPAVSLDWLLETRGKRDRRAAIEQFNAESARLAVLASAWQVRSDLHQALIALGTAGRRVTLLREQAALQQQLERLAQDRLTAGSASATEVAPLRSARLRAEVAAVEAERQLIDARARAAQVLGLPLAALSDLQLPEPSTGSAPAGAALAAAQRQSLQTRADVLGALAHYQSTLAALELEVAKKFPDFHLGPGYQWDQGQNKFSIGVSLELPVFNHNEGPVAEAVARTHEAAAQVVAVQAQAIAAIEAAAAQQAAAASRLTQLRDIETEANRLAALADERFAGGGIGQSERQSARLDTLVAQLAIVEATADSAAAAAQLDDALQIPFGNLDAVARPAAPLPAKNSP